MLGDPSEPARLLLSAVADRYDLDDVPPEEKLPAYPLGHPQAGLVRAWVSHGQPGSLAADEPDPFQPLGSTTIALQRVSVQTPAQGATGPQMTRLTVHAAMYHLRLLRRVPAIGEEGMTPPDPDDITAASLVLARDAARIFDALHAWAADLPNTLRVELEPVEALSPQGMLAGCRATATLGPL